MFKHDTIILLGYKAAGKTTAGRLLANLLGFGFLDTDQWFEPSPSAYYQEHGVEAFRAYEAKMIQSLTVVPGRVIATGGGVVEDLESVTYLRRLGTMIYLNVDFDTIIQRLHLSGRTPDFVNYQHYLMRDALYKKACDQIVDGQAGLFDFIGGLHGE